MKRLSMLVLALMITLSACGKKGKALDAYDNGKTIVMKMGRTFTVTLTNPGDGGYSFLPPTYDRSMIKLVSHSHTVRKHPAAGDFGSDDWVFKIIGNNSQSNVLIQAQRGWEAGKENPITMFSVTIKVE